MLVCCLIPCLFDNLSSIINIIMNNSSSRESNSFCDGRYDIISILGSGGVATVWRVIDRKFNVERAIKVLRIDPIANGDFFSQPQKANTTIRFSREAQLMMQLQHPNIVTVFDFFEEDDALCIVMERCVGSLASWMRRNDRMPIQIAVQVMISVLKALSFAHENGVIHRDVKPHNILISQNGDIKLSDFGLAMASFASHSITNTNAILGSIQFMSPEQRQNPHKIEFSSDLYSAAMSLVYLLEGNTVGDLYVPESITLLHSKYPSAIVDVIAKAGKLKTIGRYQSAEEMRKDLLRQLSSLPKADVSLLDVEVDEVHWKSFDSQRSTTTNPSSINTVDIRVPKSIYAGFTLLICLLALNIFNLFNERSNQKTTDSNQPSVSDIGAVENSVDKYCNNSATSYQEQKKIGPREARNSRIYDIDSDGYNEAIFVNMVDRKLSIYWGNSNFEMGEAEEIEFEWSSTKPLFSDVNRDGLTDIIGFHPNHNRITILKNKGNRSFRGMEMNGRDQMFQVPSPLKGAMHDINQDGWDDVIFSGKTPKLTTELLMIRYNSKQGLDYIIQNIPNTEEETFNWHKMVGEFQGELFFGEAEPDVYWVEDRQLFRQTVSVQGSLQPREVVMKELDDVSILDVSSLGQNKDFVFLQNKETIFVWTKDKEPCLLRTSFFKPRMYPFMTEISFGDWNQDGIIDATQTISCSYCTSNHILWIGQQ